MENSLPTLLQNLNSEQLHAVTYPDESVLVLAGAGSGKTRVLTTRMAWLISTGRADVHSLMAVTFTNKAAKEMGARLAALVSVSLRPMWLGTFHGLCHRFLRLHYREAGLPSSFQIIDAADQLALIKRLLKEWNIPDSVIAPRELQNFINTQKEAGLRAEQIADSGGITTRMIECFAGYDQTCRREGLADFAELMLRSYEVLHSDETLRTHYRQRFTHILIDEFQDTNLLQYRWLKLLAGENTAVFAVGDDDQSIYRFRGADVGNMRRLMQDFAIEKPIKLEQNYRSHGNILQAANAVIAHNSGRLGKNLRTDAPAGEKIRVMQLAGDIDEARFVAEEVQNLLTQDNLPLDEIAVLYRSNAQSRIIEQVLFAAGIPYKIYGGLRFYERQEIKHALAYLRLAVNPADENAFLRIVNFPPRGIGARTIENIQAAAAENGVSLFQAASSMAQRAPKIAAFTALIERLQTHLDNSTLPEMVQAAIDLSGLAEYYAKHNPKENERIDNLAELVSAAVMFRAEESLFEPPPDTADTRFPVLAFLANASLEAGEHQAADNQPALQLMTIHAAKGLEFSAVFLTGAEEGLFPSEYSLDEHGGLEEERRLMYVAITRARRRLYISAAQQRILHGQMHFPVISRFVDEIPAELVLSSAPQQRKHPAAPPAQKNIAPPQDYDGFAIGDNVRHAKFGTGVIIDAAMKKDSARLTINFGKDGIKQLDSAVAKLEKC